MVISILSYNIHRAIGLDRRFRPDRIIKILEHHRADVVMLQEVDRGVPRSRNMDMAREIAGSLGYPYHGLGLNVRLRRGEYGNATLSRFPISQERNIDLTIGRNKRRGCLYTGLEVPGGAGAATTLHVFNLHLGLSAHERSRQVGLLAKSPEFSSISAEAPSILGGDFNDWRGLLPPVFTDILGFSCAMSHRRNDRRVIVRTFPAFSPSGELDKIYWRGPLRLLAGRRCRLQVSKIASDHLPIVARMEF